MSEKQAIHVKSEYFVSTARTNLVWITSFSVLNFCMVILINIKILQNFLVKNLRIYFLNFLPIKRPINIALIKISPGIKL